MHRKKTNNGTKDRNRITFTEWIFRKLVKCSERYAENRFRFVSYSKMCLLNMYNTFQDMPAKTAGYML